MAENASDTVTDSYSDATFQNAKPPKKQTRKMGCMVAGCCNSNSDGFSLHHMPGKMPAEGQRFTTSQKAWINFISRKRIFSMKDARIYKQITICSGHFEEEDYERLQVQMYKYGLRSQRPHLKKGAVPTIDVVKNPFPPDYLVQNGIGIGKSNQQSSSSGSMSLNAASSSTSSSAIPSSALQFTSPQQDLDQLQQEDRQEFHAISVEYVEDVEEDRSWERVEEDRPGERADGDRPGHRAEEDRRGDGAAEYIHVPGERAEEDRPGESVKDIFEHSKGQLNVHVHSEVFLPDWFDKPELQAQVSSESSLTSTTESTCGSSILELGAKPLELSQVQQDLIPKKQTGLMCVLNGCNNTWYKGFFVHEMPKRIGSTQRGWIEFIKTSKSDFNPKERKRVHLCSGHFDRSQYEQSQLRSFQHGIRPQPPRLLATAVPHFKQAVQPFPLDWFIGAEVQAEVGRKRSLMNPSAVNREDVTTKQKDNAAERRKKRLSIYSRKKEVERILEMYEKNEQEKLKAEEAKRSIEVNNENSMQSPSLTVSNNSQAESNVNTCGQLVEPDCHAEDHVGNEKETDVSDNQESLVEEGIQIGLDDDPSAVYIMYIKEEVLSSDDDGFGENDVQQALLEEARNQLGEGDTVEIFMEEEQLSCSGVGISENRDEQASLQEKEGTQMEYINNENCVERSMSEEELSLSGAGSGLFDKPELQAQASSESCLTSTTAITCGSSILGAKPSDKRNQRGLICKKQRKWSCVLYGCNNNGYKGFSIHEMPKRKGSSQHEWIEFIKTSRPDFNPKEMERVHLCSGHFDRSQYEQSQLLSFKHGIRLHPPRLIPTAVPHLKQAVQPFPLEWFVSAEVQAEVRRKRNVMTSSAVSHDDITTRQEGSAEERRKRQLSTDSRKKEVESILEMYEKEKLKPEEARRSIEVNNENSVQSSSLMVTSKSHAKVCGKQIEPDCHAKGHLDSKKETDVSENQESLLEEGSHISLTEGLIDVYIKEEVLSSDDDDGFGENDVQQALLEEARNQLGEGDTVEIFMEEEQLSCSGVGISENRDEQASLQEVRNQINSIEDENCVEISTTDKELSCSEAGIGLFNKPELHAQASSLTSTTTITCGSSIMLTKPSDKKDQQDSIHKRQCGWVCEMFGCNNTWYKGFSVHDMTKRKGSTQRGWIEFIKTLRPDFNPSDRKHVHICSGHFDRSQYEQSQLLSFQHGIRLHPPRLLPTAVPHLKQAVQPFPLDWFVGAEVQAEVRRKRNLMSSSKAERLKAKEARRSIEVNNENSMQPPSLMVTSKSQRHAKTCGKQIEPDCHANGHLDGKKETDVSENQESLLEEGSQISFLEDPVAVYITEEVLSSDDDGSVTSDGQQASQEEDAVDTSMIEEPSCSGAGIDESGEKQSSVQKEGNQMEYIAAANCLKEALPQDENSDDNGEGWIDEEEDSLPSNDEELYEEQEMSTSQYRDDVKGDINSSKRMTNLHVHLQCEEQILEDTVASAEGLDQGTRKGETPQHEQPSDCNAKDLTRPDVRIDERKKSFVCSYCKKERSSQSRLDRHIRIHTGEKPFQCLFCLESFMFRKHRKRHMSVHSGEKPHQYNDSGEKSTHIIRNKPGKPPYQCGYCSKIIGNKNTFILHLRTHTGEKPYQCDHCSKKFAQKSVLMRHMRIHTENKPYQCPNCSRRFRLKTTLTGHMRTHTGEKPFQCDHCSEKFSHQTTFIRHVRTHTGEKPYECDYCCKKFAQKSNLEQHMRTHTGKGPYQCGYCSKIFVHKNAFSRHMRTHTGEKPYQCDYCCKKFAHKSILDRHMRTHTGNKPYQCPICSMRFILQTNLTVHMRTHTGEKPYQCDHCCKKFAQKSGLVRHMGTHTENKPYQCANCSMRFRQKTTLTGHMRTHTGEKPFQCDHCNMRFTRTTSLRRHMKTHTGEKPYQCNVCCRAFADKWNLICHMRTHVEIKTISGN